VAGLFYDASLFWIDFRNRIETIVLSATDAVNVNSGDTRHRGFESEISYDFLARRKGDLHLLAFTNLSLLDAKFTDSRLANRVGNRPAYAPRYIAKYGITFRRDKRFDMSVTGVSVGSQYFQDTDAPAGTGASFVPARIPHYTTVDFAGDIYLLPHLRFLVGVTNIADRHYYNRVFQNGIEPARDRKVYAGLAVGF
jgi:Fe(3+) dicitrate transport protein